MSWTYAGNPGTSPLDAVRFLIGDILDRDPLRRDEEITWAIGQSDGDLYLAAAIMCDSLSAQFAREADTSVADTRESLSQRSKGFAALSVSLRLRSLTGGTAAGVVVAAPFIGGVSWSRDCVANQDPDYVHPPFGSGGGSWNPLAHRWPGW